MLNYIYKHLFSLFSLLISFISIENKLHMDFLVFKTPYCPLFSPHFPIFTASLSNKGKHVKERILIMSNI